MYSGSCGPGTLLTNRLNGTPGTVASLNSARAASPDSAVGHQRGEVLQQRGGHGVECPLRLGHRLAHERHALARRRAGGSAARPASPRPGCRASRPGPRCGSTPARRRRAGSSGSASWSSSHRRSAAAVSAITTSLTVIPKWFLTVLTSRQRQRPEREPAVGGDRAVQRGARAPSARGSRARRRAASPSSLRRRASATLAEQLGAREVRRAGQPVDVPQRPGHGAAAARRGLAHASAARRAATSSSVEGIGRGTKSAPPAARRGARR